MLIRRLVKGLAVGLAIFIVVSVASGVLGGVSLLGMLVDGDFSSAFGKMEEVEGDYQEVTRLDVSVKATKLEIVAKASKGAEPSAGGSGALAESSEPSAGEERLKIETNNKYIDTWVTGEMVHIVERSHGALGFGGTGTLRIYVREGFELDEAKIEVGAGMLEIERMKVWDLALELGAGKAEIRELEIGSRAKIQAGVGKLELGLAGREDEHRITISKGLGSVTLNGRELADKETAGRGRTAVEIDAGVGAVEIKTKES